MKTLHGSLFPRRLLARSHRKNAVVLFAVQIYWRFYGLEVWNNETGFSRHRRPHFRTLCRNYLNRSIFFFTSPNSFLSVESDWGLYTVGKNTFDMPKQTFRHRWVDVRVYTLTRGIYFPSTQFVEWHFFLCLCLKKANIIRLMCL